MADGDLNVNDGNQPAWMAQLPDTLKGNETLKGFQTLGDLGSKFLEVDGTVKTLNDELGKRVKVPGADATEDEKVAFREAVGVPEKATDYQITKPTLPENMPYDEKLEQEFRSMAHNLGLTPEQTNGIYSGFMNYQLDLHKQLTELMAQNANKGKEFLQNLWKGDLFEENKAKATESFKKLVTAMNPPTELGNLDGFVNHFIEQGIIDDPYFIWYLSRTFDLISSDSFEKGAFGDLGEIKRTDAGTPMLEFPSMQKT